MNAKKSHKSDATLSSKSNHKIIWFLLDFINVLCTLIRSELP